MNIPQIMGLKFSSPVQERKQENLTSKFGLLMASPLAKDTVSFRSGMSQGANRIWNANLTTTKGIRKELKEPARKVKKFMLENFGDLLVSDKYPKNPIVQIYFRLKSIISTSDKSGTRKLKSAQEIKDNMTDLIGTKIVLRDANKLKVDAVLDRFIQLIKTGKVELLEIENKRPDIVKGKTGNDAAQYDYASLDCLRKMIDIQEEFWKKSYKGGKPPKVNQNLENDFTDANYCAIHFLFRIPGKHAHVFELQMTGNNVNEAKHIDDPVWKKLLGKETNIDCPEFDKIFEPFTNPHFFDAEPNANEIVENAKNKMNKYRGELFLFQRTKDPLPYNKKRKQEVFLPLPYKLFPTDIELKYGISSSDFDYNNLAEVLKRKPKKPTQKKKAIKANSSKSTPAKETKKIDVKA